MQLAVPLFLIATAQSPEPIFRFETDELWLNLHHYLYVLGRVEARMSDVAREAVAGAPDDEKQGLAALDEKERAAWREAVAFYAAGPSRKDLIFDETLAKLTHALADADESASLGSAGPRRGAGRARREDRHAAARSVNRLQSALGRPVDRVAVGREARAVTRAVPRLLGRVPLDDAAQVRADGRELGQAA